MASCRCSAPEARRAGPGEIAGGAADLEPAAPVDPAAAPPDPVDPAATPPDPVDPAATPPDPVDPAVVPTRTDPTATGGVVPAEAGDAGLVGIEVAERVKARLDAAALSSWALLYASSRAMLPHLPTARGRAGLSAGERERLWDTLAEHATVEEVKAATGLGQRECERRLAYAIASPERTTTTRTLLQDGRIPLARALRIFDETALLDDATADEVAAIALAPRPDGALPSDQLVLQRIRREMTRRRPTSDEDAAAALRARDTHATIYPDGTGQLHVTGEACRVAGAIDRIDQIARSLAARGETGRTLAQLRSDITLDLLLHGTPNGDHPLGELPPATVHVVVPLDVLQHASDGLGELPGHGYLTATHARAAAVAPGSIWRRLVTDPVSGHALELSTHRYRPTPTIRDQVLAADRYCRAPGCTVPATRTDLDHITPWPHGATTPTNLAPAHRRHHNLKTTGLWHTSVDSTTRALTWHTQAGRRYTTHPHDYRELDTPVTHQHHRARAHSHTPNDPTDDPDPPPPF